MILADRWFVNVAPPTSWLGQHRGVVLVVLASTHPCTRECQPIAPGSKGSRAFNSDITKQPLLKVNNKLHLNEVVFCYGLMVKQYRFKLSECVRVFAFCVCACVRA